MRFRLLLALSFAATSLLLSSCASTSTDSSGRERESTIPWNRPQSWEGGAMIPGFSGTY